MGLLVLLGSDVGLAEVLVFCFQKSVENFCVCFLVVYYLLKDIL